MPNNDFESKKNGFIADPYELFRFSMLRDFDQTIQCDNQTCPYHDKGRYCSSPSVVKIGAGGQCVPYQEWLVKTTRGDDVKGK